MSPRVVRGERKTKEPTPRYSMHSTMQECKERYSDGYKAIIRNPNPSIDDYIYFAWKEEYNYVLCEVHENGAVLIKELTKDEARVMWINRCRDNGYICRDNGYICGQ